MNPRIVLLGALVTLHGCATGPGPAAEPSTEPASAAAPTAVAASSVPPPPPGWTVKQRRGETVYCQTEPVTGSRYPKETCVKPTRPAEPTPATSDEATGR